MLKRRVAFVPSCSKKSELWTMERTRQLSVVKVSDDRAEAVTDRLAVEEPLEIRLSFQGRVQNLAVTMRTPGHDNELSLGFLFTEGIVGGISDVEMAETISISCAENRQNTMLVLLKEGVEPNLGQAERNFYTTSSCGVCGKASIEAIRTVSRLGTARFDNETNVKIAPAFIQGLPGRLAAEQAIFAETGGLHAAALFDMDGALRSVREDVGRHNAVDKLIGAAMIAGSLPLSRSVLLLSGRASFELVQKAAMASIPVIAAVGAPSSLAVSLAEEFGITLIGFLRSNRFNIYSGAGRIQHSMDAE